MHTRKPDMQALLPHFLCCTPSQDVVQDALTLRRCQWLVRCLKAALTPERANKVCACMCEVRVGVQSCMCMCKLVRVCACSRTCRVVHAMGCLQALWTSGQPGLCSSRGELHWGNGAGQTDVAQDNPRKCVQERDTGRMGCVCPISQCLASYSPRVQAMGCLQAFWTPDRVERMWAVGDVLVEEHNIRR